MNDDWNTLFAQMSEANDQAVAAVSRFHRMATRLQGEMTHHQLRTLETCLEVGAEQIKLAGSGQDPKELFEQQVGLFNTFGARMAESVQQTLQIQMQAGNELMGWFEEGAKAVQDTVEASTAPAPHAPAARRAPRSRRKAA